MFYMVNWLPVRQFKLRMNRNFKLDAGRAGIREQGAKAGKLRGVSEHTTVLVVYIRCI